MKKNILLILCISAAFSAFSKSAAESAVETYRLKNDIPVYVRQIPDNRICAVYFVVKGGTAYLTPETSGLENAVFSMMSMGSEKYSYAEIQALEFDTQSSISSSTSRDGSVFAMTSIDSYFDRTFDCFADAFLNPLFSQREYALFMTT